MRPAAKSPLQMAAGNPFCLRVVDLLLFLVVVVGIMVLLTLIVYNSTTVPPVHQDLNTNRKSYFAHPMTRSARIHLCHC